MHLFLLLLSCLFSVSYIAWGHGDHGDQENAKPRKPKSEVLKKLEQKWKAEDFVRDVEHIKEDLKQFVELKTQGEITDDEMLFYMFRMHDFDDNEKLDGLELMCAVYHSAPQVKEEEADNETTSKINDYVIEGVDNILALDKDNDGFLSYGELKRV